MTARHRTVPLSSLVFGYANCVCLPASLKDPESIARLLEAYTCIAAQTTYDAYVERAITYKHLPYDENSKDMIKIIFDGRLFDPVDVYGWGSGNRNVYNTKFDKLVSHVEQYKKSTVNKLEKNISQLLEIYGAE